MNSNYQPQHDDIINISQTARHNSVTSYLGQKDINAPEKHGYDKSFKQINLKFIKVASSKTYRSQKELA